MESPIPIQTVSLDDTETSKLAQVTKLEVSHRARCYFVSTNAVGVKDKPDDSGFVENWIKLIFTWSGKSFELEIADSDRCVCLINVFVVTEAFQGV